MTIGFKKLVYESSENDSATQEVCAIVMEPVQPAPGRRVVVTLTSMNGTATGNGCRLGYLWINREPSLSEMSDIDNSLE